MSGIVAGEGSADVASGLTQEVITSPVTTPLQPVTTEVITHCYCSNRYGILSSHTRNKNHDQILPFSCSLMCQASSHLSGWDARKFV